MKSISLAMVGHGLMIMDQAYMWVSGVCLLFCAEGIPKCLSEAYGVSR